MKSKTEKRRSGNDLPLSLKLAFGAPAFAGAAMAIPIGVLMPRFYSDVIMAPLGYIAIAIALARAFDALTDPFMGWLSDRTHTRWGRRKPYIAAGVPFAALAFVALFSPPEALGPIRASIWFGAAFGLFFLFDTIASVPAAALGAEVTLDYNKRSTLFGYRSLFIAAGTVTAALLPTVLHDGFGIGDERTVYRLMAGLYAGLLIVLSILFLIRVPERREFMQRPSNPFVPGVRRALRNRPFRILLTAGIVNAIPAAIPAILMPYFVRYVVQPSDPLRWVGFFLVIYLGSGLLFVPIWMAVAQKVGKLPTLIATSVVGIAGSLFYFFVGPGETGFAAMIYLVTGTVSMAGTFLVPAMAADVIDYDELRTGKRREAQYTAFWALIPKLVSIPGSSIPLAILATVGYVPNVPQSPQVVFWIAFMYSIFPAAFYVAAVLIVRRYPISEAVHEAIRGGIAQHGVGKSTADPLTGEALPPRREPSEDDDRGWFLDYFSAAELKSVLQGGAGRLVRGIARSTAVALGICATAAWLVFENVGSADARPPLAAVFGVVVAGGALTAFFFHLLRLKPARQLAAQPPPAEVIRDHLTRECQMQGAANGPEPVVETRRDPSTP